MGTHKNRLPGGKSPGSDTFNQKQSQKKLTALIFSCGLLLL